MRLEGKVAVISGGGSGIGAATARRFAADGAKVVVTGRREGPLAEVADETNGVAIPGDIVEPGHAEATVAAAVDAFGGLDICVANAGVGFGGTAADVTDEQWHRTLEVNVTGAMRLARASIPAMTARGAGSIVLVSSISGVVSSPSSAAYVASKAALIGLAVSIAVDHAAAGIRCNALCPGWVHTAMGDDAMDELAAERGIDRRGGLRARDRHGPDAPGGIRRGDRRLRGVPRQRRRLVRDRHDAVRRRGPARRRPGRARVRAVLSGPELPVRSFGGKISLPPGAADAHHRRAKGSRSHG